MCVGGGPAGWRFQRDGHVGADLGRRHMRSACQLVGGAAASGYVVPCVLPAHACMMHLWSQHPEPLEDACGHRGRPVLSTSQQNTRFHITTLTPVERTSTKPGPSQERRRPDEDMRRHGLQKHFKALHHGVQNLKLTQTCIVQGL